MSDILELRELMEGGETIRVEGNTHIGRTSIERIEDLTWAVGERVMPPEFRDLELFIHVEESLISRNHCAILKNGEGYDVMDLESKNGTYLNYVLLTPREKNRLSPGDLLQLGSYQLRVMDSSLAENNNHALLVGHDGGNLRGVENDLDAMVRILGQRGFKNPRKLHNGTATKSSVLNHLESLVPVATSGSRLFFYYSGHGDNEKGLELGRETLTPKELYEKISVLRGKKVVVLDSCYAGIFLPDMPYGVLNGERTIVPEDTLVIAATRHDEVAYEDRLHAGAPKMGVLTREIERFFNENPTRFHLRELGGFLDRRLPAGRYKTFFQEPQVAGASGFTIYTVESNKI